MSGIRILDSGLLSIIQDTGRIGYKKFGMPPAGVMDGFAYQISQFLVQNDEPDGVIETNLVGVQIEFLEDMLVAVTGAQNELFINDKPKELWQAHIIKSGDILKLKTATNGVRNYIAFSKKMELKRINGSLSTYLKSGIGGFKGRALKKGDEIKFEHNHKALKELKVGKNDIPIYKNEEVIRVVLGPEDDAFSQNGLTTFLKETYTVTQNSDRMGYRLSGAKIEHKFAADILSNTAFFGSVQVPNDGQPIILMADAQTSGGYAKIATVIMQDLTKLAQIGPGCKIKFRSISQKDATQAYKKYQESIEILKEKIKNQISFYNLTINGKKFNVKVEEI